MIRSTPKEMIVLRHVGILLMIYLGLVLQTSLVPAETAGMGRPFLPAIVLVMIAVWCEATASILWSAILGLLIDGLSTEHLGIELALAAMLALGLQWMQPVWRSHSLLALVSMFMLTCVTWRITAPMTHAVLAGRVIDIHSVLTDAVQDSAWTAVIGGAVILVGRGLMGHGSRTRLINPSPGPRWQPVAR